MVGVTKRLVLKMVLLFNAWTKENHFHGDEPD